MRFSAVSDPAARLATIAQYELNYDPSSTDQPGWHHDRHRRVVGHEAPGDPEPGGVWETACGLVHDYEFAEPSIMHAYFRRDVPLEGRDMLLEGKFVVLRFPMGVRVDAVVDETRDRADGTRERSWGWSYRTLEHHLERGRLVYEVVKNLDTGQVEFVLTGVSQRARIPNPVIALGFSLFGRVTQRRFYTAAAKRLERVLADIRDGGDVPTPRPVDDGGAVVRAPGS